MVDRLKETLASRDELNQKRLYSAKRLRAKSARLAMTDPLTGLANRNQFQARIADAFHLSKRLKQPFALLLLDLDKFKPVNDTYGHSVGDEVLRQVAEHMTKICRNVDTVARIGGDEFVIILQAIEKSEDAIIPAKRLIQLINTSTKNECDHHII